jgi:hypothetical protein
LIPTLRWLKVRFNCSKLVQFRGFDLQPVVQLVRREGLLFGTLARRPRSGLVNVLALVSDLGFFAAGFIACCEPIDVAVQFVRILCVSLPCSQFDTKPMNFLLGYLPK